MKTIYKSIVTIALALITSTASYASILIDGLYYEFFDETSEAMVVKDEKSNNIEPSYTASTINIPEEVTYNNKTYKVTVIGEDAFLLNKNLTSISIPETVRSIGASAFTGCEKLKSITLPSGITKIERSVFAACQSLKSVTIPEGVTIISESAFANCSSLESVAIPSSVTFISPKAFSLCSSLKSIIVKSPTPIDLFNDTFDTFGKLYVPEGSKDAYSKAPIWKNFTIIEDTETTGIANVPTSITQHLTPVFDLSGHSLTAPRKGVDIINGKKVVIK